MIIVDTGPLVAAAITNDAHHNRCTHELGRLFKEGRELLVPSFVAAEVCYWLGKADARLEAAFLRSLESGLMTFTELTGRTSPARPCSSTGTRIFRLAALTHP